MKILHVNFGSQDGAGLAAGRIVNALNRFGVQSQIIYWRPFDKNIAGIDVLKKKINGVQNIVLQWLVPSIHSLNAFPSGALRVINEADADVVHLHWINAEMISIEQIPKIKKPVVWTFHDMWPICGAEHYSTDKRYITGYQKTGNEPSLTFIQRFKSALDRWVWERKVKAFKEFRFHIITPSVWMTDCVRESYLFQNYPSQTISNCLDLDVYKPLDCKAELRRKYGFPLDKKVILFGAYSVDEERKGGDLLEAALVLLRNRTDYVLGVFGRSGAGQLAGLDTVWLGRIDGDEPMAEIYNTADLACVPSRQETFGQTASEPLACGVPVVAFDATGLKDVVDHQVNGYLATAFSPNDFAAGIEWILDGATTADTVPDQRNSRYQALCHEARIKAERCFSEDHVAALHAELYERALSGSTGNEGLK
jgi:glycosyltransferase involved in cell wall biosynthesis